MINLKNNIQETDQGKCDGESQIVNITESNIDFRNLLIWWHIVKMKISRLSVSVTELIFNDFEDDFIYNFVH